MKKKNMVLVDMDELDSRIYSKFYPRISHKQRERVLQEVGLSAVVFEDEREECLLTLSEEEFSSLPEQQKFIAYENTVEMMMGIQEELDQLHEKMTESSANDPVEK